MDRSINAGIAGVMIAVLINLFVYLDFVPSFLAAIFVIYFFRLGTLKDGLVASFMTYIFTNGILSTLTAATFYLTDTPYELTIDIWIVLSPIVNAVTALIAGYIGIWLSRRRKPAEEQPSLPPPLPPV